MLDSWSNHAIGETAHLAGWYPTATFSATVDQNERDMARLMAGPSQRGRMFRMGLEEVERAYWPGVDGTPVDSGFSFGPAESTIGFSALSAAAEQIIQGLGNLFDRLGPADPIAQTRALGHSLSPHFVTRELIRGARSTDELIHVTRARVDRRLADRLETLTAIPVDSEEGEEPIKLDSAKWLLAFVIDLANRGRGRGVNPLVTATPDGNLQADWRRDHRRAVSIRFFMDGSVQVLLRDPRYRAVVSTTVSSLLTERLPVVFPDWL